MLSPRPRSDVTAVNEKQRRARRVLRRVSHQLTTFPSGHVAVATAAALTIWPVSRPAGLVLAVMAAGIAAGAVAGRYHFAVDVALGVVVGAVAVMVSA